ncbi:glycosyl hydrolase family 2 protein [Planotetraspora mira]|uniref:Glycoside hydrolase n=1 Tax=Planotetraspora mira TaxID=58121 RepID=A0A8J3X5W7_9ACTN|nr:hypothetical protein [Planotetraspora mira]GII29212.1 hypothetical protein Pmi06nite_26540 [Planotetraspora mira]
MNLFDVLRHPPRSHSPAAIWWWSGEPLRRDRLRWQMERLTSGGVHNLVILNLAPSGPLFGSDADDPPFFSEEWWELLGGVCADAAELGVSLWFYDQLGFSGADIQARLVQESPSFAGQWLGADGGVSRRGFDYLSPEACATLIDRVHGEFERRLGHWFGDVIVGSFQDELPSVPTWSDSFAEEFATRRGYEFPRFPEGRAAAGHGEGSPVWRDYHRTRAELAEEAFFRPLAEWHDKHGLLHGCDQQDPARAGHPVEGVQLYADYTRTHRWFGAPGSDHHGDARLHSSLAHLYGRPRTWIESFHSSGWGGTLEETFDWLLPWLRAGATLYNPHAVYYTTKAGWWEWAPPSTDWRQPYWRHHHVFADAVTRLCAALSLGRHLCDIAVLFPTGTSQAGVAPGSLSASEDAARAQRVYRELVGDMAWFQTVPGALDRLCLDADAIDDESVWRASVVDGRLTVSTEAYQVIVLPACTVLDERTAERLDAFAEAGGRLVAVGALPEPTSPDGPVARLRDRFAAGQARFVPTPDLLGEALDGYVPRVEAPVPPLVREVEGTTVVFLTAAFPRASDVSVGSPGERGVELGWLDVGYDFDPGRYVPEMRITVRGVRGTPMLVGPFSGRMRALPYTRTGDAVEVVVPFDDGPAALLLFTGDDVPADPPAPVHPRELDLGDVWEMELVPTLDDTWGDFGRAGQDAELERWTLQDADGAAVRATFGPHALWCTVPASVPPPVHEGWRPAVYSTARGIDHDPVHRDTLGPKGHVPEEFLDFGAVAAGEVTWVRTLLDVPEEGTLVVGAAAAKTAWIDDEETPLDDAGYLAVGRTPVEPGRHLLLLRLAPEEDLTLRAHVSLVRDAAAARRPEWITGSVMETVVHVAEPPYEPLQVASMAPCVVRVNGAEAGRQGGFDPYAEAEIPRVRRYDVAQLLRPGPNSVSVESEGAVLVDGLAVSGPGWKARVRRRQHGDPASLHLHRRPHPLPGAGWIESGATALPAVLAVPGADEERVERLWVDVPPGAVAMEVPAHGRVTVHSGDVILGEGPVVALDGPAARVELRVVGEPGFQGGAALTGPIRFTCRPATIRLGDWQGQGLAEYSGGVRYRTGVAVEGTPGGPAVLDLGRVRGTAEVILNGRLAGIRVCSPYVFDLDLAEGENEVEILVLGTLAPYLSAVSPTHFVFPGQRVTGLFGPVRLRSSAQVRLTGPRPSSP